MSWAGTCNLSICSPAFYHYTKAAFYYIGFDSSYRIYLFGLSYNRVHGIQ